MIEEAKRQASMKNLNIKYTVGEAENLPFEDESFDCVTVGTAFHWFVNERAINEIKRVIKKNGLLYIFWTLTTKEVPEKDSIPPEIFQKYNWARVPSELRDLKYISKFLIDNGLDKVETKQVPFSYNATIEERVGLEKTASSYGILSEENKINILEDIRSTLTEKLGNRENFTLETELQICYGFKN